MIEELFDILEAAGTARCLALTDAASGLRAFLALDDLTLGPAAGGVRTRRYSCARAALEDAVRLARTMTIKCALAGLAAGGGKLVVMDHDRLDRSVAFQRLGESIEELKGIFRTAGDLGTTADDLAAMARKTQYVYPDDQALAAATARGLLRAIEACAEARGMTGLDGLHVAVQGCGAIGAAAARALTSAGARVIIADIDQRRAQTLAAEIGAEVASADELLMLEVDVIAPCAIGGVLTADVANQVRAWAVCGPANNVLADPAAEHALVRRGILYVPDVVASAGAVIEGVGAMVMKLPDRTALIDRIGATAREVLDEARGSRRTPTEVAEARAWRRIAAARSPSSRYGAPFLNPRRPRSINSPDRDG